MSLGLAVSDGKKIYLAIESKGLDSMLIPSKLHELQLEPDLVILVTGGIEHWRYVFNHYKFSSSIEDAQLQIKQLLSDCTSIVNDAHCLLCGFANKKPVCYRIDKTQNDEDVSSKTESLEDVQPVGFVSLAVKATLQANMYLDNGIEFEVALKKAINDLMPHSELVPPIETKVMHSK